jgi:hypothetical protein
VTNGVFVAAEFAYVKVRPTRVTSLVEQGKPGAALGQDAIENLDDYLAVSQLGITLSSLGLGWLGERGLAALIEPVLGSVLPAGTIHVVWFALGFGFTTFLHVVFGELAPKTFAIQEAERVAFLVSPLMKFFYYAFVPGILVFNGTANYFTRLAGVSPASESEEPHTEEEIRMILTHSEETGHVDVDEVEMIESVFELGDTNAREVMTPRAGGRRGVRARPLDGPGGRRRGRAHRATRPRTRRRTRGGRGRRRRDGRERRRRHRTGWGRRPGTSQRRRVERRPRHGPRGRVRRPTRRRRRARSSSFAASRSAPQHERVSGCRWCVTAAGRGTPRTRGPSRRTAR